MNNKSRKIIAIISLAGCCVSLVLILILSALDQNYKPVTMALSVLGGVNGIRGIIFNSSLALFGALLINFSVGLHQTINSGKGSKMGPIMTAIGGLGMIGAALFHCDAGCANILIDLTPTGAAHIYITIIAGTLLTFSPFLIYARLKKDIEWRQYQLPTLVCGLLIFFPNVIFWINHFTAIGSSVGNIMQKIPIFFLLLWVGVMSEKMWRLSNQHSTINTSPN